MEAARRRGREWMRGSVRRNSSRVSADLFEAFRERLLNHGLARKEARLEQLTKDFDRLEAIPPKNWKWTPAKTSAATLLAESTLSITAIAKQVSRAVTES